MRKLKYGIAIIAIIGIVSGSIPYIIKTSIDNTIKQKQQELQQNGIKLIVLNSTGYLNSKREVIIKIQDTIKFMNYMSKVLETDIKMISLLTDNGVSFENLSLKGIAKNTNIFPKNIDILLSFDELPNKLKQLMKKEPIINKLIKELSAELRINRNGNLTFASLNNIVLISNEVTVKILEPKININENNYLTTIQNMIFKLKKRKENVLVYFDGINDNLNYNDRFDLDRITTIDKIKLNITSYHRNANISYESENNKIKVQYNSNNNELNMGVGYNIDNMSLSTQKIDTKLDSLTLNIGFNGLKEQSIKEMRELINYQNNKAEILNVFKPKLQEILNHGFSMHIESNISNISNNKSNIFKAKIISIDLTTKIKRNNLNKNSNPNDIAKSLSVTGTIKMDKNIVDLLKPMQKYNTNIIKGISNFNIKLINDNLLINGYVIK